MRLQNAETEEDKSEAAEVDVDIDTADRQQHTAADTAAPAADTAADDDRHFEAHSPAMVRRVSRHFLL